MTEAGRSMQDAPVDPPTSPTSEEGMMRRAVSLCCLRLRDASLRLLPPFLTRDSREALQLALDSVELDADDERALGAPSTWVTPKRLRRRWEEGKPFFGQVVRRQQRFAVGVGGVAVLLVGTAFAADWWQRSVDRALDAAESSGELFERWSGEQSSERSLEVLRDLFHAEQLLIADLERAEGATRGNLLGMLGTTLEQQAQVLARMGAEQEGQRIWDKAFQTYRQAAALGDLHSLELDGRNRLMNEADPRGAVRNLGRAHQLVQGKAFETVERVSAHYYSALVALTKLDGLSSDSLMQMKRIENRAFSAYDQGKSAQHFYLIAYNAAALQAMLIREGRIEASEAFVAADRLLLALKEAGSDQGLIARWIIDEDPTLDYLRGHKSFEEIEEQARAILALEDRR